MAGGRRKGPRRSGSKDGAFRGWVCEYFTYSIGLGGTWEKGEPGQKRVEKVNTNVSDTSLTRALFHSASRYLGLQLLSLSAVLLLVAYSGRARGRYILWSRAQHRGMYIPAIPVRTLHAPLQLPGRVSRVHGNTYSALGSQVPEARDSTAAALLCILCSIFAPFGPRAQKSPAAKGPRRFYREA